VWDEDSGTLSYVEHVYETPDFYYPVVRVTDAEGAQDTAEASVFAGQWRISTAVTGLYSGAGATSLKVVNGNPAISFYGNLIGLPDEGYWYVQANNPLGEAWNSPILVFGGIAVGAALVCDDTLAVVNGRPAIAALDGVDSSLNYARAEDTDGATWGIPLEVCAASTGGNEISMAAVDGRPAVAFSHPQLSFVRALDADGTAWGTPVQVNTDSYEPSLAVVNGAPAISYVLSGGGLCYVRANDSEGNTWGEPITVDAPSIDCPGAQNSLAIVNGRPAICYEELDNVRVKYIRATDEVGTSWGTPLVVAEDAKLGYDKSLMFIQGYPAICYVGFSDSSLKYVRATNADGSSWRAPVTVSADNVRLYGVCLNEINGHPAISYVAGTVSTELMFAIYR
jgi:hypothetical protein